MNNLIKIFTVALFVALMSFGSVSQAHVLDGAKELDGHYYKLFQSKVKWDYAKKFCESMGGYLTTIESERENEVIVEAVSNGPGWHYWIGAYRDSNKMWRWINGKAITGYTNWRNSGQGDKLSLTHKVVGAKNGTWYGINSSFESCSGFICEWDSAEDAHESNM